MIISFGSKETEKIWQGQRVNKMPLTVQEAGRRKLRMINNAADLADLRIPTANRLEKLSGSLKDGTQSAVWYFDMVNHRSTGR